MKTQFPDILNDWRTRQTQAARNASLSANTIGIEDLCYGLAAIEAKLGVDGSTDATSIDARTLSLESRALALETGVAYTGKTNTFTERQNFTRPVRLSTNTATEGANAGGTFAFQVDLTQGILADGFYSAADVEMVLQGGAGAYIGARVAQHNRVMIKDGTVSGNAIAYRGAIDFWTSGSNAGSTRAFEAELMLWAASGSFALPSHAGFYAKGIGGAGGSKTVTTMYGFYAEAQKATGVTTGYGFYSAGAADDNYFAGTLTVNGAGMSLYGTAAPVFYIRSNTAATGGSIAFYDSAWAKSAAVQFDPANNRMILGGATSGIALLLQTSGTTAVSIDSGGSITATIGTTGNLALGLVSSGSFAPNEKRYLVGQSTGGAVTSTIQTIATASNSVTHVEAVIAGIRVNGTAEVASYHIAGTFRNVSGTLTQRGSTGILHSAEDQAGFDVSFSISGTNILVQVTGIAAYTMEWTGTVTTNAH